MDRVGCAPTVIRVATLVLVAVAVMLGTGPGWTTRAQTTVPVSVTLSGTPRSGSSITIELGFPDGFVMPDSAQCSWELAWGDSASLHNHIYNETYGSTAFRGWGRDGYCKSWTVTLPYSASAQWYYSFGMGQSDNQIYYDVQYQQAQPYMSGSNGASKGTGVGGSSIPGVWLSMPTGGIVGDTVTATAHAMGSYVQPPTGAYWNAALGPDGNPTIAETLNHSMTFSFKATLAGTIAVAYNDTGEVYNGDFAGALVDPKIRSATKPAPTATPKPKPTATPRPATPSPVPATPSPSPTVALPSPFAVPSVAATQIVVAAADSATAGPTGSLAAVPAGGNGDSGIPFAAFVAAVALVVAAGALVAYRWRATRVRGA